MTESLTNYRLALIQMRSVFLGRTVNLNKAEASIREAAGHGAKLVCLPEAFDIGYDGTRIPDMMALAQDENGETLQRMKKLAAELEVYILAPTFYQTESGVENRAFLIDDQGTLLGGYSKTHPVGDERKYLQRGTEYPVFDTKLGKIGISICYDACFPETSRLLALKGAEVMLVPAAWRGNFYFKEWWDLNLGQSDVRRGGQYDRTNWRAVFCWEKPAVQSHRRSPVYLRCGRGADPLWRGRSVSDR